MAKLVQLTAGDFRAALHPSHAFGAEPDKAIRAFVCSGCGGQVAITWRSSGEVVAGTPVYPEGFLRMGFTCDESKLLARHARGEYLSVDEGAVLSAAWTRCGAR